MSTETSPTKHEKKTWRQKRENRRMAKIALQEAQEAIDYTPEGRFLLSATRALVMARKQKGGSHPINRYEIAFSEYNSNPNSPSPRKHIRTLPVGEEIGLPKGEYVGLVGAVQVGGARSSRRILGGEGDQLYLATYDEAAKTGTLSQITNDRLGAMTPDQLEALAEVTEMIEYKERVSLMEWRAGSLV